METLSIDQIKTQHPNQWVLIGNPELFEPEVNGSILSKLIAGIVLCASKDKREIACKAMDLRKKVDFTTCIYINNAPKRRLFL